MFARFGGPREGEGERRGTRVAKREGWGGGRRTEAGGQEEEAYARDAMKKVDTADFFLLGFSPMDRFPWPSVPYTSFGRKTRLKLS